MTRHTQLDTTNLLNMSGAAQVKVKTIFGLVQST